MSWLFSRALVEAYSEGSCSDGAQSVRSSLSRTPQAFLSPDRMTAFSRHSQSGMTFEPLTDDLGEELLMWFRAAFRAKGTAAPLEDGLWLKISGRRCGGSWQMSLPGTYLPKTPRDARLILRQMTCARWVAKPDALPFPRKTWVLTMFGTGIGYLHTPTATANYSSPSMQKWPNCRNFVKVFGAPDPTAHEWLMGWPLGWTDLKPLVTDKYLNALPLRGTA